MVRAISILCVALDNQTISKSIVCAASDSQTTSRTLRKRVYVAHLEGWQPHGGAAAHAHPQTPLIQGIPLLHPPQAKAPLS
jgi:hypothetical protein